MFQIILYLLNISSITLMEQKNILSPCQNSLLRKKTRLLSSLLDLKLNIGYSRKQIVQDESKRKLLKYCPIRVNSNQTEIYQNFTLIQKKKSSVDKALILKSLSSHFIFTNLIKDKTMQDNLIDKFKLCRVNKGQYLMKQNDNASSFFILHEGQLVVEIDNKLKRKIQSSQGFGELALMYSSPRSASIKANKSSFLWFIDRATFRKAISSLIQKNMHQTRKFIEQTPFFIELTSSQKDRIASIAIITKFSKGQTVCKQSQLASSMYIVKSGALNKIGMINPNEVILKQGSYFGQYTMIQKNCKWKQTVVAQQQAQVIALGAEDVQNSLGKSLPLIVIRNKAKQCLNNSMQFTKLSSHYRDLALDCFKIKNVTKDQKISTDSMLFMILQGQYEVSKGKIQNKNPIEKVLFGSIVQNSNPIQIKFKTIGKIAWATPKQILSSFRGSYQQTLQKSVVIEKTASKQRDFISDLRLQCSKYSVNEFKVVTKLGQGQFGIVFLVTDPSKSKLYALKCISKYETVKNKLEKHLINQKVVMQQMTLYTPFCVNFIRSYKDQNFVYFLMEYINGLQLFDVIRLIGLLNVQQSRFYASIILEFLQKIHSKNIIYRDLKPQNIMVSEDGYLKLIDMGTCKKMQNDVDRNGFANCIVQKTFTIIGTPNYMAPEIISGKGYSNAVDLWSLGIVIYQFMAGYVPFGQQAEDPYQIYQQIIKKSLVFPHYMKDQVANSFITQLLSKVPQTRLGGSYSSLKSHSFLSTIQWSALLQKKIKPAYQIPKNKLIQVQKLIGKSKSLHTQLPPATGKVPTRKDINMKWDQCF